MKGEINLKKSQTNVGTTKTISEPILGMHDMRRGTIDDEGFSKTFRVVSLENMKDLSTCSCAGILGTATRLKIDEKDKCFNAWRHHINCSFETIDKLLNLSR